MSTLCVSNDGFWDRRFGFRDTLQYFISPGGSYIESESVIAIGDEKRGAANQLWLGEGGAQRPVFV